MTNLPRNENRPLPKLGKDLLHKIDVGTALAIVTLRDELNACWVRCYPVEAQLRDLGKPDPTEFFPPFLAYGVARHRVHAEVLLATHPPYSVYSDWLHFALTRMICEELAPCRPVDASAKSDHSLPAGEWQLHIALSLQHFDHPEHRELTSKARDLINALEDPSGYYHWSFTEKLQKALSREILRLLAKAIESLGLSPGGRAGMTASHSGPEQIKRRRGPKPDLEKARRVQQLVDAEREHGDWKDHGRLKHLCEELDSAEIQPPNSWQNEGCEGWVDTLDFRRDWVVKAIERQLAKLRANSGQI